MSLKVLSKPNHWMLFQRYLSNSGGWRSLGLSWGQPGCCSCAWGQGPQCSGHERCCMELQSVDASYCGYGPSAFCFEPLGISVWDAMWPWLSANRSSGRSWKQHNLFQNNVSCRAVILLVLEVKEACSVWIHHKHNICEFIGNLSVGSCVEHNVPEVWEMTSVFLTNFF